MIGGKVRGLVSRRCLRLSDFRTGGTRRVDVVQPGQEVPIDIEAIGRKVAFPGANPAISREDRRPRAWTVGNDNDRRFAEPVWVRDDRRRKSQVAGPPGQQ